MYLENPSHPRTITKYQQQNLLDLFIQNLSKYLKQKNITLLDFLTKQILSQKDNIEFQQFEVISKTLSLTFNKKYSKFETMKIFQEISEGYDKLTINRFLGLFSKLKNNNQQVKNSRAFSSISTSISLRTTKTIKVSEERRSKYLKKQIEKTPQKKNQLKQQIVSGLKKLKELLNVNDALQLYQKFCTNPQEHINHDELQSLLKFTKIEEFQNKLCRQKIVKKILSGYPTQTLSKDEFIGIFNFNKQRRKFIIRKSTNLGKIVTRNMKGRKQTQISANQYKQKQKEFNQQYKQAEQYAIKDQLMIQSVRKEEFKIQQNPNSFQKRDIMRQALQKSDLAAPYYRRNFINDSQSQIKYIEKLQKLLVENQKFKDENQPRTHLGKYTSVEDFFMGQSYSLFAKTDSVIQRQNTREGLAQQIEPKDIIQGQLGNCYFLSSVASLASVYPNIISDKFIFDENPAGYYVVKLFINGQWKYFQLDGFFPSKDGERPVFSKSHGNKIWVMLLQKCWAKYFGSYQKTIAGNSKEAFQALTGAPTQSFSMDEGKLTTDNIQKKIQEAYNDGFVVTTSDSNSLSKLTKTQQEGIGLISDHSYSILKIVRRRNLILIKVRNPWGCKQWKGKWSFESNSWTPQLREKLNYKVHPNDGSFYMQFKDFLFYFGSFNICKLNPLYFHTVRNTKFHKNKSSYFRISIKQEGEYTVSLYQQSKRMMKIQYTNFKYSPCRMILLKVLTKKTRDKTIAKGQNQMQSLQPQTDKLEYLNSVVTHQSETCQMINHLQTGDYLLSCEFDWHYQYEKESNITFYGLQKVQCDQVDFAIQKFFKNSMIESFSKKYPGTKEYYDKIHPEKAYREKNFLLEKGLGYLKVVNTSEKQFQALYAVQGRGVKNMNRESMDFKFNMFPGSEYVKGFFLDASGYQLSSRSSISYFS